MTTTSSSSENASTQQGNLSALPGYAPHSANPILPGYFADPSIVQYEGKTYIYATIDPWGGEKLGCWESEDFKQWTYRDLNWPTKKECTSPTSWTAMVWAPSVVRAANGRFYMAISVGSEVWIGTAEHPLGPWRNALGDKPLIPTTYNTAYHMIDAEYFVDEDGTGYLYWGSGLNWVNGRCFVAKLQADMVTFDGEPKDVTPANYFEAPFMVKHAGRYYLMYSSGKTIAKTYQVHYAVGDNPFGPFEEGSTSPVLVTDEAKNVLSPGHHAVFVKDGQPYILYHRHSIPFDPKFIGRQTCVDRLVFTPDGVMEKVVPTHEGPALVQGRESGRTNLAAGATASASSQSRPHTGPEHVLDDNYATRWAAAEEAAGAVLQLDLGEEKSFVRQEIRPEYAWKSYRFTVESSPDGQCWETLADFTQEATTGSPIVIQKSAKARFLRLVFPSDVKGSDISLFEWGIY